jgi:1,4-dihydroxy-6-naphthoate synthase
MGFETGPLLVCRKKVYPDELNDAVIAIPGENTTANLLLTILFPDARRKKIFLFSDIEEAVLDGEADAGLLIHETRFTYEAKGLKLVCDLGKEWVNRKGVPVPLGGIAIKSSLDAGIRQKFNRLRRKRENGYEVPRGTTDYMKKHAQELKEDVNLPPCTLYVTLFPSPWERKGKKAIETILEEGFRAGAVRSQKTLIFGCITTRTDDCQLQERGGFIGSALAHYRTNSFITTCAG